MRRTLVLVPLVLALVPASAGTSAAVGARAPVALTAAPARLLLRGSEATVVRVRNSGTKAVAVDVARAGFALDLRGRPKIVKRRAARCAARWLTFRPAHFVLGARATAHLLVTAKVPSGAAPGDHDAVVLLTTRPVARARVAVRLRMGVVVVVRAPGKVVRRLRLPRLRVAREGAARALQLVVVNAGNVTEPLRRVRIVLSRARRRRLATLSASPRDLRPHTRGVLEFHLRARLRGWLIASVVVPAEPGRPITRRAFRLRL